VAPTSVIRVRELTPSQKGAAAEAAAAAAVLELGLTVLRPLSEGRRYDLVIDLEPRLMRIQCKLAQLASGVLVIRLATNRLTPAGYLSTSYSEKEIGAVAVYSPELRKCFLLPIGEVCGRRAIHLRVEPARNNQVQGVKWAHEYKLESAVGRLRGDLHMGPTRTGSYTSNPHPGL
jgi:hypothetical protein